MSRRVLIAEPDAAGRAIMDRVLAVDGLAIHAVPAVKEARELLDANKVDLVIVDELAGTGAMFDEVRWLRRQYPRVPVIVMGTLFSQRAMQELLRIQVMETLTKPFTPAELRDSVTRVLAKTTPGHADALEYQAAIATARASLAAGRTSEAAPALARAAQVSPFDSETMALRALLAELSGCDSDADRGYRAALALRREEDAGPPDPLEALARLDAYKGLRPVAALRPDRAGALAWIVADPIHELAENPPCGEAPHVVVLSLGLISEGVGTVFLRDSPGRRAVASIAGSSRPESIAAALDRLGLGSIVAGAATRAQLDLDRVAALRKAVQVSVRV